MSASAQSALLDRIWVCVRSAIGSLSGRTRLLKPKLLKSNFSELREDLTKVASDGEDVVKSGARSGLDLKALAVVTSTGTKSSAEDEVVGCCL